MDDGSGNGFFEIITQPSAVMEGEKGLAGIADALSAVEDAYSRLQNAPQGTNLADIFPEDWFKISPVGSRVRVGAFDQEIRRVAHYTVGVPVTGLHAIMEHAHINLSDEIGSIRSRSSNLRGGLSFGNWAAGTFAGLGHLTDDPADSSALTLALNDLGRHDAPVASLRGYAALVYTQTAALA